MFYYFYCIFFVEQVFSVVQEDVFFEGVVYEGVEVVFFYLFWGECLYFVDEVCVGFFFFNCFFQFWEECFWVEDFVWYIYFNVVKVEFYLVEGCFYQVFFDFLVGSVEFWKVFKVLLVDVGVFIVEFEGLFFDEELVLVWVFVVFFLDVEEGWIFYVVVVGYEIEDYFYFFFVGFIEEFFQFIFGFEFGVELVVVVGVVVVGVF